MHLAISCRGVEVVYVVRGHRPGLRDKLRGAGSKPRVFSAVRGVDIDIYEGESVGIVGRNGSGKSTLLRTLAGLLPATGGEVFVRSLPALLGVNAVLRPLMSGRSNAQLGLLAQGLRLHEVEALMDDVIAFAELDDFIDLPMDTYSSGMRARLHFAIATAVAPEILLIDEALAVGDRHFREKSARRLDEHRSKAGTMLLVSHNLGEIRRSCQRAIWIEQGVVKADGPTEAVLKDYESS